MTNASGRRMNDGREDEWNRLFANALLVLPLIPEKGDGGTFACPCCKTGLVHWARARSNNHIRFQCDTCKVSLIQ